MIGVFDSGSGGLTVLQALAARLPDRDFLYLGDHAHAPYGTRSGDEVYGLTQRAVAYLLAQGCRLIVIACNTAAAVALRRMQQTWLPRHAPDARVLGVHVPLVEAITGRAWRHEPDGPEPVSEAAGETVAIFATPRTVATGSFPTEIAARAPAVTVLQQACPGLADAIEAHAGEAALQTLVDGFTQSLLMQQGAAKLSAAVLACTHYPFAETQFRAALPADIRIMTQPGMVATALEDYLVRHPAIDSPGSGRLMLRTTGDTARLNGLTSRLPPPLRRFSRIEL